MDWKVLEIYLFYYVFGEITSFQNIKEYKKITSTIIDTPGTLTNLIYFTKESGKPTSGNLNDEISLSTVKNFYCPLNLEPQVLSLECVRQISIKPPGKRLWHPKSWIPPVTACIDKCCKSHQLPNSILTYILETCCKTFWLIDWCLTPILEIFPIYRGIRFFGKNEHRFNA